MSQKEEKIVVFIGPPGAGKGTQASQLKSKKGYSVIIAGDILRAEAKKKTDLGIKLNNTMSSGQLVSDDIVIEILGEAIERNDGSSSVTIIDGFPRTIAQAQGLDQILSEKGIELNKVFYFEVSDKTAVERNSNRRYCPLCKKVYNLRTDKPAKDGICGVCGARLVIREDDKPEVIVDRLKVYQEQTAPLLDYYRERGILTKINGEKGKSELMKDLEYELND